MLREGLRGNWDASFMLGISNSALRRVHVVSFSKDGAARTLTLRRSVIGSCAVLKLALIAWAGFSLYLLFFRDTKLGELAVDQARMRAAYEERLAADQARLDEARNRQVSAQFTFEGRLRELLSRQAELETRTETVAQLLRSPTDPTKSRSRVWLVGSGANAGPAHAGVHAPEAGPSDPVKAINDFAGQKPHPIEENANISSYAEERQRAVDPPNGTTALPASPTQRRGVGSLGPKASLYDGVAGPLALAAAKPVSIETVVNSLDAVERLQVEALQHANSRAAVEIDQLRGALKRSGLDPARFVQRTKMKTSDTGGPFLPLPKDGAVAGFDVLLHGLKVRLEEHDELSRMILMLPLRQPLNGRLEITSGYGARKDPFGMGWALHPGIDLRAEEGTIVRATASGKVANASYVGGYGNMVEIEHGEGVSTRYGHLSAILVSEGELVTAGTPIGRVGSTGRSTGPHLHYETRIDGEPVDPLRFLNSSDILVAATGGVD
jgi:murein DD-endopeptidase MepM/ murein hydrolase activator NlpD